MKVKNTTHTERPPICHLYWKCLWLDAEYLYQCMIEKHLFSDSFRKLTHVWKSCISFVGSLIKPDRPLPHKLREITKPVFKTLVYEIVKQNQQFIQITWLTISSGVALMPLVIPASRTWAHDLAAFVQIAREVNDNGDFFIKNGRCIWICV